MTKPTLSHDLAYKTYLYVLKIHDDKIIDFYMCLELGCDILWLDMHAHSLGTLLDPSSFIVMT